MARELPKGNGAKAPVVDISADIERFAALGVLGILLADRSTGGNIIWASNVFSDKGESYAPEDEIYVADVTGENSGIIRARASKSRDDQAALTRAHAEVFTPYWIVRKMLDWADEAWYEQHEATPTLWRDYVRSPRLEITCGEAPFLVTRYDAADGTRIPVYRRCGVLDRKLIQIIEHVRSRSSWLRHAIAALENTYGYEYQGDNLLIARVNVLVTIEDFCDTAGWEPLTPTEYKTFAEVISWNLWQMDGLSDCVPNGALIGNDAIYQLRLPDPDASGGQMEMSIAQERGAARIYDWEHTQEVEFGALKREVTLMDNGPRIKFDYVIGNPPYQEEQEGENETYSPPVYHRFIDASYEVGNVVELIHPARFLFNAGKTPKAWNRKMLNDRHVKVLQYWANERDVFPGQIINGGVAITYYDSHGDFGAIEVFTQFPELNAIRQKVCADDAFESMETIVYTAYAYHLTDILYEDHPELVGRMSKGHQFDTKSNILELMPEVFTDAKNDDSQVSLLGRKDNKRATAWIRRDYVTGPDNLDSYKVIIAAADGASGTVGKPIPARVVGAPTVAGPGNGTTESFLTIGKFAKAVYAENALKYIKTKFARTMLGILKVTQHVTPVKWKYVPLQDFTETSDIDWTQSIADIDRQLDAIYGLDDAEVAFINKYVAEME